MQFTNLPSFERSREALSWNFFKVLHVYTTAKHNNFERVRMRKHLCDTLMRMFQMEAKKVFMLLLRLFDFAMDENVDVQLVISSGCCWLIFFHLLAFFVVDVSRYHLRYHVAVLEMVFCVQCDVFSCLMSSFVSRMMNESLMWTEKSVWQLFSLWLLIMSFSGSCHLSTLQSWNPCAYVTADDQAEYCQANQDHNLLLQVSTEVSIQICFRFVMRMFLSVKKERKVFHQQEISVRRKLNQIELIQKEKRFELQSLCFRFLSGVRVLVGSAFCMKVFRLFEVT